MGIYINQKLQTAPDEDENWVRLCKYVESALKIVDLRQNRIDSS